MVIKKTALILWLTGENKTLEDLAGHLQSLVLNSIPGEYDELWDIFELSGDEYYNARTFEKAAELILKSKLN